MKIVHIYLAILIASLYSCKMDKPREIVRVEGKTPDINAIYQHYTGNPQSQAEIEQNQLIDYIVDKDLSPTRSVTGLYYQIHEKGTGEKIKFGDDISVHYKGMYMDGTVFQDSREMGKPLSFKLGPRGLIKGWVEGLRYMNEGTKATLLIPSKLGYESKGRGDIPGNTPLIFEMEIVEVK